MGGSPQCREPGAAVFAVLAAKKQRAGGRRLQNSSIFQTWNSEITARNLFVSCCKSPNDTETIHKML
jgi:hypothetical protein